MPKNIIEVIGAGFSSFWKNLMILLPFLFQSIAQSIVLIIGLILFISITKLPLVDFFLEKITEDQLQQAFVSTFSSSTIIFQTIAIFILGLLAIIAIMAYFNSGIVGMTDYYFRYNKKPSLKEMHEYGKKFFWRYFFLELLGNFVFLAIVAICITAAFLSNGSLWVIIPLSIFFLAALFLYLFVALSPVVLIVKDCSIFQSIKKCFIMTKNNFWQFVGLGLLYVVGTGAIEFIPVIGTIARFFIIDPAITFSFTLFTRERSN